MNRRKIHYAWYILVACCLMQGGTIGLVQNCRGLFYNPVCTELGFKVSAFTLYSTAHGIGAFFMLPFAAKLLDRYPVRRVLGIATLFFCGSTALMGSLNSLAQWYVAGAIQGISGAFLLFLPVPILLNNWFHQRFGTAMGIAASMSGVMGVVANPIIGWCISTFGWRAGYYILGLACFALVMPGVLFIVVRRPSDIGMTAYGEDLGFEKATKTDCPAGAAGKVSDPIAGRAPVTSRERIALVCAVTFATCAGFSCSYCQHYSNYAATLGFAAATGAMLVSASMAGNIVGKLTLGMAGDRFGVPATLLTSCGVVGLAYLVMTLPVLPVLFVSACISGISMPISVVCVPMLVKALFRAERYSEFYSYATMATSLMSSVALAAIGGIYDLTGSYLPPLLLGTGLNIVCIAVVLIAFWAVRPRRA